QGAHHHTRHHVAGVLGDNLEPQFFVSGVREVLAHVDGEARGARDGADHAVGHGVFAAQHAYATRARQDGAIGGENGNYRLFDAGAYIAHGGQHGVRVGDVAVDAADTVH